MCHGRKSQRNATLLPLKMKEGAISQGLLTAIDTVKAKTITNKQKTDSPLEPPERDADTLILAL